MWPAKSCWVVRDEIWELPAVYLKWTHKEHRKCWVKKRQKTSEVSTLLCYDASSLITHVLQSYICFLLHFPVVYIEMCHMFPVCCLSGCFTCVSRQWLKSEDIQRISLFFHNKTLEKEVGECIATSNQQAAAAELLRNANKLKCLRKHLETTVWSKTSLTDGIMSFINNNNKKNLYFNRITAFNLTSAKWANIFTDFLLFIFWRRKEVLSKKTKTNETDKHWLAVTCYFNKLFTYSFKQIAL